MKKTIDVLTIGLWAWLIVAVYTMLYPNYHPAFIAGAITNATVFLVGRYIVRKLTNLRVDVQLRGKSVVDDRS